MPCFQSSEQVSQEEFAPRGGAGPLVTPITTSAHLGTPRHTGRPHPNPQSAHSQPAVDPFIPPTSWGCEEKAQQSGDSAGERHGHRQLWLRSARCFIFLTTVPLLRIKCGNWVNIRRSKLGVVVGRDTDQEQRCIRILCACEKNKSLVTSISSKHGIFLGMCFHVPPRCSG